MNNKKTIVKNNGNIKRNFLFVSRWGESLDIAYATLLEGNNVKMYIEDKPSKEIGYGFVPKVARLEKTY